MPLFSFSHRWTVLAAAMLCVSFVSSSRAAEPVAEFRLATFSADVTPPLGHPLLGGTTTPPPAHAIDDPLFARGFVLTGGEKPVVLVSIDWCEIRNDAYDRWREVLAAAAGTTRERVLVTSIHQHDAPLADLEAQRILDASTQGGSLVGLEYHEACVQKTAVAVRESLAQSVRVTHFGLGQATVEQVTSNRRFIGSDGTPRFDRSSMSGGDPVKRDAPDGTIDPVLRTLSFWDGDKAVCALHVYAVHPMSHWGSGRVTADFPGLARSRRQDNDRSVFQIYASGCSGNVTPGKYNDGGPGQKEVLADRLYDAMVAAWKETQHKPLERADFRNVPVHLPPRDSEGYTAADLRGQLEHPDPKKRNLAALALSWRKRVDAGQPIDLPVLDFGSAVIALLPGESYVEFQIAAQKLRPAAVVLSLGYGECGPGYVPIEQAFEEHDSNLDSWCWTAPGAEKALLEGLRAVLVAEADFSSELPRIPPKSPDESLQAIRVKPGFHLELVASEPLLRSPMAMDFDEYGRAYVVELPEYNQYASKEPHGKGAIKRLEDTDGDGRYDRATVYVDDLTYPTAVACWKGGVLIGVAPDLWFCQDTDGDGIADVRRKLFTGFGQDKSGEGMLNSFRWRIDNRFHIPTGLDGGDVVSVHEGESSAPASAPKPLSARGQHFLLDPRTMTLQATSGGGQHGMSLDDWSLNAFVCGNSEPAHAVMYDGRYVARNPYMQALAAAVNIAPEGKFTKLMRLSPVEPWRILRTRLRSQGAIPGSDEGGQPSGFFTGATGITVYRGDAWPVEYRGQLFVGEVANNLVYRAALKPQGVGWTAERADTGAEFLASSDNWFRPVQFANAPDGTLYVLDMYRELIEGAAFLAPQILKHMDPSAGADKGRIYRIAPDGFQRRPTPRLGDLTTADLVTLLEHPNAWHRDTASRLVYERQDGAAIAPLRELATKSASPLARIMALYSLQGLASLDAERVVTALSSEAAPAREQALRLSEGFARDVGMRDQVIAAARDPQPRVRYQAAFSLGAFAGEAVTQTLADLAVRDGADPWMQLAIHSSLADRRGELLGALLREAKTQGANHVQTMLIAVAGQIGSADSQHDLALLVKELDELARRDDGRELAVELVKSVLNKRPEAREILTGATGGRAKEIVLRLVRDALSIARDDQQTPAARAAAVRTLGAAAFDEVENVFADLLQSRQPQPVQAAVLEVLARFDAAQIPSLIVSAWPSQTPQLRATSVETLFTRPTWIAGFLDGVEGEKIARQDIDPARVALLQKHADPAVRERAQKLFAGTELARRQEVVDSYQKALNIQGDAVRGRQVFRKNCTACHKLEGEGESIGAELNAIRDRGLAAVMLNILDPNREVKPQFLTYAVELESGRSLSGMIASESANSLVLRKADKSSETVLRAEIVELTSTGMSFMPEGLEKQIDPAAMADLLAYLNSIK